MASLGVDGLVSGLDTTSLINNLIQSEAIPQTRLKTSLSSTQKAVTALQSVNTKMAALSAAATRLTKPETWTGVQATSSSDAVTATAASGALPGRIDFAVQQLASAKSVVSAQTYALSDTTGFTSYPIEVRDASGNVTASVTPVDGSLTAVVNAINAAANSGVRAVAVQVSPGQYRLQVGAVAPGTDVTATTTPPRSVGDFTLSGGAITFTTLAPAQDARLHVGPATGGYDVLSHSNTVEGLVPGVTLRLQKTSDAVSVDVASDPAATADAVQALVDAANAALKEISNQSTTGVVGTDGKRTGAGPLAGDSLLRQLAGQVIDTVSTAIGGKSASGIGISSKRDGTITFDRSVLLGKMAADPSAVRELVAPTASGADGIAVRLAALAETATNSTKGTLTSSINARTSTIKDLGERIGDWDLRLAARKATLQKTYSALEVSLGSLKNQSSWLAGQLASLPSS